MFLGSPTGDVVNFMADLYKCDFPKSVSFHFFLSPTVFSPWINQLTVVCVCGYFSMQFTIGNMSVEF